MLLKQLCVPSVDPGRSRSSDFVPTPLVHLPLPLSLVQIYKEQAYDLLNPTSIMMTPSGPQPQPSKQGPAQQQQQQGLPGALRMRWNKADDFYLENLFKVSHRKASARLGARQARWLEHCSLRYRGWNTL